MGIIDAIKVSKYFPVRKVAFARQEWLKAVDRVSFTLKEGAVFSIVGESGSGKTTLARLVLGLISPTSGQILFNGKDIRILKGNALKDFRRSVQVIFQDPFASLNPRMTVLDTVSEPLRIHGTVSKFEIKEKVVELLESVGLQADILNRYPHEFSGGQRQRICIARALAVSPRVLIADEPLSALDVSIQAQILNILQKLQKGSDISFLFISHDLRVVRYFSDEIAVMYLGNIVEYSKTEELFSNPLHPYTVELLSAVPEIKPGVRRKHPLKGDVPSPIDMPPGCPFHPRCPKKHDLCDKVLPELREISGRFVSCHKF